MKRIVPTLLVLSLAALPVPAQEADPAPDTDGELSEGLDLLSEGTRLLLRGLMDEMEPALRELEGMVKDLNAYHPPEMLPNGDIIIRRKTPLEPEVGDGGEIEL
ncbi:hypothetical protein [Anianabacter salinae]|uniref:hypothetical protein n=1 Tax=Anianabacter salinae TaxID=2851023 RepID=UPI00225E57F1|nr:hypothetical protein [Anianabacter salinae]MBV0913919.1 hypothetical protein [Anianabacter salinae]